MKMIYYTNNSHAGKVMGRLLLLSAVFLFVSSFLLQEVIQCWWICFWNTDSARLWNWFNSLY